MSIPKRVLKIVARSIKGVCLCKALLVVSPTEHILRGFFIDRTSHKGKYNLWRVIVPLYRPMPFVILNYSNIIGPRQWIEIAADGIQDAADRVTGYILDGHLEYLKRLRGPKAFLEHISWMIGNNMDTFLFDYAMTQYMLGNHATCLPTLEAIVAKDWAADMRRGDEYTWAKEIIVKLKVNPSEVAEILQQFERTNVHQFALAPTLIGPRPQIVSSN
jgi:hypothetical protein